MLENIKLLLGISGTALDSLLTLYITQCTSELKALTRRESVTDLGFIVEQMVVEKYQRRGNEGISSISYSGVSESYESGYSSQLMSIINKHRSVVFA